MKPRLPVSLGKFLAALAALFSAATPMQGAEILTPLNVAVSEQSLHFKWTPGDADRIELHELPMHTSSEAIRDGKVLWQGSASAGMIDVPRFDGARDRLYAKFQLADSATHQTLGDAHYVTDFSALKKRTPATPAAKGKKGLTCILDMRDAVALGIQQANQNIDIGGLIDWQSAKPTESFEFEGHRIGLRPHVVAGLDRDLLAMDAAGIRVTGILLNYVNARTPRESPLVHPLTNPATVAAGPSAFNTATEEGLLYYRAILHWLVERYTRPDAKFGRLGGLVIGNEVQSHWTWYHLGAVKPEVLLREYYTALRTADLATRSVNQDFPIYVSLEHHWMLPASDDPLKGMTAVEVLDGVSERARREGDFPWNVAFHPYPENLGDPRFWRDQSAPLRFDAPRITFHNLEVLPTFLRQPRFLYNGKPRRIALTEQGFHCPAGADGETLQAAAFALAWKKVQALPEIESFLYHRHVDHPLEDGLHCGLREHDGSPNILGIGRARKIWEVVQKAGTPQEDEAFNFALAVVGRQDWSHIVETSFEPARPSHRESGQIVFDFVERQGEAKQENLQALELRRIGPPDEVQQRGLLEHPKPRGLGKLSYRVRLPDAAPGQRCLLVFDALLNHEKSHGVGFSVRIEDHEVFTRKLAGGERVPVEIDLAEWRGRDVVIEFVVDALGDPTYDWSTWVSPRVVLRR